jgi:hypothetical protein
VGNSELVKESSLVRLLVMGTRAGPETRLVNAPPAEGQSGLFEGFGRIAVGG